MEDTVIRRGWPDRLRGLDRRFADRADEPLVLFHDLDDRTPRWRSAHGEFFL